MRPFEPTTLCLIHCLALPLVGCDAGPAASSPATNSPATNAPAASGPAAAGPAASGPAATPPTDALATWHIDHEQSVLEEHRGRGRANDFARVFPAEEISAEHQPVNAVASFTVDDAPLFYFRPDLSAVVVDARRAGELTAIDVTHLARDASVGKVEPATVAALGGRRLLELLVRAGVIRTYLHMSATLSLVSEDTSDGAYRASLQGKHLYYTNEENVDEYGFVFSVAPDGAVTVAPRR